MSTTIHNVEVGYDGRTSPLALELGVHNRVVVRRPLVRRADRSPFPARSGSGLLVPAPWTNALHPVPFILHALHDAIARGNAEILVVGHHDPAEAPSLAESRADVVRCLMEADRAGWVTQATRAGGLGDVKAYLNDLYERCGWSCMAEVIDDSTDVAAQATVAAFQREYNARFSGTLDVDGVCGEQTLGAIFDVFRFEWAKWLHKYDLTEEQVDAITMHYASGSGVDRSLLPVVDVAGRPGVDILVIESAPLNGSVPAPAMVYGSPIARFETYRVAVEPWGWEMGPYTIITDTLVGEPMAREDYTLRSTDGVFELVARLPADAAGDHLVELRFEPLPCDKNYDLSVSIDGAEPIVLFTNVPYNELHRLATEIPEDE